MSTTRADARAAIAHQGHYAGSLSRLLAYGADLAIISVIGASTVAIIQLAINVATPWSVNLKSISWLIVAGQLAWAGVYFGVTWVVFHRSPGMSILGLRITSADGSALTRRRAIIRLIAFPLGFLTLGAGFLGIIFGRTHQAIYDRIAKTAVIYDWDAEAARLRNLAARGAARREARAAQVPATTPDR